MPSTCIRLEYSKKFQLASFEFNSQGIWYKLYVVYWVKVYRTYQNYTRVKPVEDKQGQADPWDDPPGQESVEVELQGLGDQVVGHEGVQNPEGDVGKQ